MAILPSLASVASASVVYNNVGSTNEFITGIPSIYFGDATLAATGSVQINQFNIGYDNLASTAVSFDLLVQFYNTANYGAAYEAPVGTNPIGSMIDITGLSVAGGDEGLTGLLALSGQLPIETSGTVGFEYEFVTPGATSFSDSNEISTVVPIFRKGAPSVGSSSASFGYDSLHQNDIVGDAAQGDVWMFPTVSHVDAEIGGTAAPAVIVSSGQTYTINASSGSTISPVVIAGITINAGGIFAVAPAAQQASRQLLVVTSPGLSIAGSTGNWTGLLDLSNNDLDLPGASLAMVTNQVRQGYNNGNWNGTGGITSSVAASRKITALGVIQNNQGGTPLYTTFDRYAVGASDVLVKYTYYGDTDLNGVVDGTDYSRIDYAYANNLANPSTPLTGWFNGDFNYDGVIDGSDYALIDNSYNSQGLSLAAQVSSPTAQVAGGTSAVPEPASIGLILATSLALLSRRHQESKSRARSVRAK